MTSKLRACAPAFTLQATHVSITRIIITGSIKIEVAKPAYTCRNHKNVLI